MDLLDHDIITARYFFPRAGEPREPYVVEANGHRLNCVRRLPVEGAPLLLHFHGNGEIVTDWVPHFADPVTAAGLGVLLAEYRGFGGSSGTPRLAAMLDDALAIADAAGVPPQQIVVYGRSVGSLYAAHVAAHRPVSGLIIESGIADLDPRLEMRLRAEELGTTDAKLAAAIDASFDQRAKIEAHDGPVLVIHALDDHLVPFANAEQLAAWAGPRAELMPVQPGDHNSLHFLNGTTIIERTIAFARAAVGY